MYSKNSDHVPELGRKRSESRGVLRRTRGERHPHFSRERRVFTQLYYSPRKKASYDDMMMFKAF